MWTTQYTLLLYPPFNRSEKLPGRWGFRLLKFVNFFLIICMLLHRFRLRVTSANKVTSYTSYTCPYQRNIRCVGFLPLDSTAMFRRCMVSLLSIAQPSFDAVSRIEYLYPYSNDEGA